jgi:transposase
MGETRQTSTAEFKHEAVRLVTGHGDGVAKASRNLGINTTMLGRWTCEQEAREDRAFPGKGRLSPAPEARHGLREDHKRLRMEWEM